MTENKTVKIQTDQIHVAFMSLSSCFSIELDFSMDFSAYMYISELVWFSARPIFTVEREKESSQCARFEMRLACVSSERGAYNSRLPSLQWLPYRDG